MVGKVFFAPEIRAIVINRVAREDRKSKMMDKLQRVRWLSGGRHIFLPAIDGYELKEYDKSKFTSPYTYACYLSHITALKAALLICQNRKEYNISNVYHPNDSYIMILEDDLIFHPDFDTYYETAIPRIINTYNPDILFLGFFPMHEKPVYTAYDEKNVAADITGNYYKHEKLNYMPLRIHNNCLGAFAYMVSCLRIKELIDYAESNPTFYDNMLQSLYPKWNCMGLFPFLCGVESDFSDNSQKVVNYDSVINKYMKF